jgi:hypothetical protein
VGLTQPERHPIEGEACSPLVDDAHTPSDNCLSSIIFLRSVTHYFGHPDDDYINMCSCSQYDILPEKENLFPPLQDALLEGRHGLLPLHSVEILDFHRLHYNHLARFCRLLYR